jgi:hypothetical protein
MYGMVHSTYAVAESPPLILVIITYQSDTKLYFCFISVSNLVSHPKERTQIDGDEEQCCQEYLDLWARK